MFPDQVACAENLTGEIRIPDHPLVNETIANCLDEAMDLDGLIEILDRMDEGTLRTVAIDTPEPSPFCHEILNANPYAFLDDAPLEERRTRAVQLRRTLAAEDAEGMGALDPAAIAQVAEESWPVVRDADELHDALLTLILLPPVEEWRGLFRRTGSAQGARRPSTDIGWRRSVWIAPRTYVGDPAGLDGFDRPDDGGGAGGAAELAAERSRDRAGATRSRRADSARQFHGPRSTNFAIAAFWRAFIG